MGTADMVMYGEVIGNQFIEINGHSNEYFQVKPILTLKGSNSGSVPVSIKNYHVIDQDREAQVWGDLSLKLNKRYLLFLMESNEPGVYVALCMSYYSFEEIELNSELYLTPTSESQYIHLSERPDGKIPEKITAYKKADLLKYLLLIKKDPNLWSKDTKPDTISIEIFSIIGYRVNPPSHCTFLFTSEPYSRWTGFKSQTLPVRYRAGGDDACSNGITYTQDAVTELNNSYPGIALTNSGPFSGYTPDCNGGNAFGGNFTSYCNSNLGGSRNVCIIYNDPCSEIPDLAGCSGTLALGGHYTIGSTHTHQGKTWSNAGYGFVVVNNNTGSCYCSIATYQIMMQHEITHTLGIGHIDPEKGTANMNPSCCNNITQKDIDCLEYTYPQNLPVELVSFYGSLINKFIELTWITASEINSDKYIVELSHNGEDFTPVEELSAKGTSFEKSFYQTQIAALQGDNYVRLQQMDFDGSQRLIGNTLSFKLNPGSDNIIAFCQSQVLRINIEEKTVVTNFNATIFNSAGMAVKKLYIENTGNSEFDISDLPAGYYMLIITDNHSQFTTPFTKTN